jgi:cell division protein FtsB
VSDEFQQAPSLFDLVAKVAGYASMGLLTVLSWLGKGQVKRVDNLEDEIKKLNATAANYVSRDTLHYTVNDLKTDIQNDIHEVKDAVVELRQAVMQSMRDKK